MIQRNNKFRLAGLIFASAVGASACGTEMTVDDAAAAPSEGTSDSLKAPPPNTIPPSNAGFALYGNSIYQMKNKQGRCAYETSTVLATTASCDAANNKQFFAVYTMPSGTYNLCIPGTGRLVPSDGWCRSYSLDVCSGGYEVADTIHAICFQPTKWSGGKATDGRFQDLRLAKKPVGSTGPYTAELGLITESGGILTTAGRVLSNNSSNVVVLGSKSGNPDQVWSFF